MFPLTQKSDPGLYPYRQGLYFAFYNALNWQIATATPTVLFMAYLGADSFQTGWSIAGRCCSLLCRCSRRCCCRGWVSSD